MNNKNKLISIVVATSIFAVGVGAGFWYKDRHDFIDTASTPANRDDTVPVIPPAETLIPRQIITGATQELDVANVGVLSTEKFEMEFYETFPVCNWDGVCGLQAQYYLGEANIVNGFTENPVFKFNENSGEVIVGDAASEIVWEKGVPKYVIVRDKQDNSRSYVAMLMIPEEIKITIPGSSP